jgi:phage tail sheath protein FI
MAQRTINSPGVEIRESDLSLTAPANVGTSVYITGFAQQGPIDEVLLISTKQELVQIFGPPTNSAERYFHHSISELLNSPATVYAGRLPYGDGNGDGFGSKYSALVYPVTAANYAGVQTSLNQSGSAVYLLGAPTHATLTEAQYLSAVEGAFTWQQYGTNTYNIYSGLADSEDISGLGYGGIVILNKAQTTINQQYEGLYVGLTDNAVSNPATNFVAITGARTVAAEGVTTSGTNFTTIPLGTLAFQLSADYQVGTTNSISEVVDNLVDYDLDDRLFDDYLSVGVFKLRKSLFANEAYKLDYVLTDGVVGSINTFRKQQNPYGGSDVSTFIENAFEGSRDVTIMVNDYLSNRLNGGPAENTDGTPKKKIRILSNALKNATEGAVGFPLSAVGVTGTYHSALTATASETPGTPAIVAGSTLADKLFPVAAYTDQTVTDKLLGDIPSKIERSLDGIKNDETYNIDIVVEGGLGTIYSIACADDAGNYYDEFSQSNNINAAVNGLRTSNAISESTAVTLRNNYSTVFNKFEQFVKPPYEGGDRGDCIFIADPIRQICIKGKDSKILDNRDNNFQTDVYWPIKHQFENENTSYAAVYGNWAKVNDSYTGQNVWVPFSPFAAAVMARTDAAQFPWFAPAGFSRGLIANAIDIAVNPNQKQRDEFYKANINPVAQFPNQGLVVFGQKTLHKRPSAFDRINVRRLFLALERPTKQLARQFVFEQNSEFTRTRLTNALRPIFERARNNEGLYDYLIVCDERNNTPSVIDANELVVDIYIKPTRTAEFILVNFYATRTDANFQEIVGS